jgi:hypothetical protein
VVAWALVVAALLPAGAGARRDDLPTEGRKPDPGATVADATKGVTVQFTCPEYHPGHHRRDRQPRRRRLLRPPGPGSRRRRRRRAAAGAQPHRRPDRDRDRRRARDVHDSDRGLLPTEPGTYWWQSYRECRTYICPFGTEISDIYPVTVKKTVCTVDRAALCASSTTERGSNP